MSSPWIARLTSLLWPAVALVAIMVAAHLARFDIRPSGSGAGFLILDRWNGTVQFCSSLQCAPGYPPRSGMFDDLIPEKSK